MLDTGWRSGLALLSLAFVVACAGTYSRRRARPYLSNAAKNVTVRTEVERGVRATLYVYSVDATCNTEYLGSLSLDRSLVELSIPEGALTYLEVSFDTSSFMAGSRISSIGSLLKPRAGDNYELTVSYQEDIYNFVLRDTGSRGGAGHELPRRDLVTCGAE